MAGSYKHVVTMTGKLDRPEMIAAMLETKGDVYEAVEEMYGMVWYLAARLAKAEGCHTEELITKASVEIVEEARQNYEHGLELSPGRLEEE